MAAAETYNEVMYAAGSSPKSHDYNFLDPLYKWDTRYPERMNCHSHHEDTLIAKPERRPSGRRMRNRNSARFKTQPITFDEIQEVDEDAAAEDPIAALKDQFTAFSKSMDGLLPVAVAVKGTPSPKDSSAEPDDGASAASIVPNAIHLVQHERSRSRRLKRRAKKGIQELPELEKDATDTQAG